MSPKGIGGHHSAQMGSDTWLTPLEIIAALGAFDLDPCAAPEPRPWPTAATHIARPDDGLAVEWSGRVWLNPPYSAQVATWVGRLARHGRECAYAAIRRYKARKRAARRAERRAERQPG